MRSATLAVLAVVLLIGVNACPFVLEKPTFSNVTSQNFSYRLSTNETLFNLTEKATNVSNALGYNDTATIAKIAAGILDYINSGLINSNKTLVWNVTTFESISVLRVLRFTARVDQVGVRRTLNMTGKYVDILQKIPAVYKLEKVCKNGSHPHPHPPKPHPHPHPIPPRPHPHPQPPKPHPLPVPPKPVVNIINKIKQARALSEDNEFAVVDYQDNEFALLDDTHDHEFCHHQHCWFIKVPRDLTESEKQLVRVHMLKYVPEAQNKLN